MKERILALISAVALVAIAIMARQLLANDDGASAAVLTVACSPDLAEVCEALADGEVIAADPPTLQLADAAEPPADLDAWITWDPAPQVANFDADAPVWDEPEPLGSAPLAVLANEDATTALVGACRDVPNWACVLQIDETAAPVGLGPVDTAQGLARIAELAAAASDDLAPDTLDASRLQALLDSPANRMDDARSSAEALATRPGNFDAVVVPEHLAVEITETGRRNGIEVVRPDATYAATVVVAGRDGADVGAVEAVCATEDVADALAEAGVEPCDGTAAGDELAGFLWQVRERMT